MLPVPTVAYLASFTGRDVSSYSPYADQALIQSTLMFGILTKLDALPEDPDQQQLALNAIMQMADRIYLEQPYAEDLAAPFNSESVGSYSYEKSMSFSLMSRLKTAGAGTDTGLFWWDLAIEELQQVDRSLVGSGSVHALERHDIHWEHGERVLLGPADIHRIEAPFDINAELNPPPRL